MLLWPSKGGVWAERNKAQLGQNHSLIYKFLALPFSPVAKDHTSLGRLLRGKDEMGRNLTTTGTSVTDVLDDRAIMETVRLDGQFKRRLLIIVKCGWIEHDALLSSRFCVCASKVRLCAEPARRERLPLLRSPHLPRIADRPPKKRRRAFGLLVRVG